VMFATLNTGTANRALATADLNIPDTDTTGACGLHAVVNSKNQTTEYTENPDFDSVSFLSVSSVFSVVNSSAAKPPAPGVLDGTQGFDAGFGYQSSGVNGGDSLSSLGASRSPLTALRGSSDPAPAQQPAGLQRVADLQAVDDFWSSVAAAALDGLKWPG